MSSDSNDLPQESLRVHAPVMNHGLGSHCAECGHHPDDHEVHTENPSLDPEAGKAPDQRHHSPEWLRKADGPEDSRTVAFSRMTSAIRDVLESMGLNPDEPGLRETPERVARMYQEFNQEADLVGMLKDFEHEGKSFGGMLVQTHIPFVGMCEHHLLPFSGEAHIGYIPGRRVVGLSKLTRVTQAAGRLRPSMQERITEMIADAIEQALEPMGVIVVTESLHGCMSVRGVNAPGVVTKFSAIRGNYVHVAEARSEFFAMIAGERRFI